MVFSVSCITTQAYTNNRKNRKNDNQIQGIQYSIPFLPRKNLKRWKQRFSFLITFQRFSSDEYTARIGGFLQKVSISGTAVGFVQSAHVGLWIRDIITHFVDY